MRESKYIILAGLLLPLTLAGSAASQTYWNCTRGNWSNDDCWYCGLIPCDQPTTSDTAIIDQGVAEITQAGEVCKKLYLPRRNGAHGSVEMTSGDLHVRENIINGWYGNSTGRFTQSGGHVTAGRLEFGRMYNCAGTYEISGDAILDVVGTDGIELGVYGGPATFIQTGGTVNVSGYAADIYISHYYGTDNDGYYNMSGGKLVVSGGIKMSGNSNGGEAKFDISNDAELQAKFMNITQVGQGPATFNQTGGTANFSDAIYICTADPVNDGYYKISGGRVNVGHIHVGGIASGGTGHFDIEDEAAQIYVSDLFHFLGQGRLSAVDGSTIHLSTAAFFMENTEPANVLDLENLTLVFDNLGPGTNEIEAAGEDMGPNMSGFAGNFALGTVRVLRDTELYLVDAADNNPSSPNTPDVVYVHNLELSCGSVLYLNDVNVYCECLMNMGGTIDDSAGGSVTAIGTTCSSFDITADPNVISPDGQSQSEITVTLILDGAPAGGELIYLSTNMGQLTDGLTTGQFISATTDGSGQAVVHLIADTNEGTARVMAKYADKDWTTCCEVQMAQRELALTTTGAYYHSIPGRPSGDPLFVSFIWVRPTMYGYTRIPIMLELTGPGATN